MPNHVTNIITATKVVLNALKGPKHEVDFNQLIPMPKSVGDATVNGSEKLALLLAGKLSLRPPERDMLARLELANVIRDIEQGILLKWDSGQFSNFILMCRNLREHGFTDWHGFGCEKWGTKWNAYSIKEGTRQVNFQTAWSAPHPVIQALAEKFPEEEITHQWADEDIGRNLGHRVYHRGNVTDVAIDDPVDFALTLSNHDRECYRKNKSTGKWEYVEDER